MNDALASGARAHAVFTRLDESGFDVDTHVFTVDHRVKVFASHPGGNDFDPEPYASEVATCAGPFRLGAECWVGYTSLRWDGCP